MLINLVKNKNKIEKIETIRKHNIQKCINWCDKYKLPCNKFADKINIFLPINEEDREFAKNTEASCRLTDADENDSNDCKSDNSDTPQVYIINNNIDDEELFDNSIINKD